MKLTKCDVCMQVKENHCWAEQWKDDPHVDVCVDCDLLINIRLEQRFGELEAKFGATVLAQAAIVSNLKATYDDNAEEFQSMFGTNGMELLRTAISEEKPEKTQGLGMQE